MKRPLFLIMLMFALLFTVQGAFAAISNVVNTGYEFNNGGQSVISSSSDLTASGSAGISGVLPKLGNGSMIMTGSAGDYTDANTTGMWVGNQSFSFSMWVNFSSLAAAQLLWDYDYFGGTGNGVTVLLLSSTSVRFAPYGLGNDFTIPTLSANKWYHIAGTRNNSNGVWSIYVNGTNVQNLTLGTTLLLDATSRLRVGSDGSNHLNGKIDSLMFFNRTLTAAEIATIYNGASGIEYPFGEVAANVVTVSLTNAINGSSMGSTSFSNVTGNLTFNYFNITGAGFCVSYTGNGTGTNCTASGSGTGTYFNASITEGITGTQAVTTSTYQSLIEVSAYRLFLNTSIASFNGTNGQVTNTTTSGTVLLKGLSGNNNVKIDVGGNFSKNITCSTTSFTTRACNATGIYDNMFTFQAKYKNGTLINNFTINTTNVTLGGLLYSTSTTNNTLSYPLLQGYAYNFKVFDSGLATENVTLPANASNNYYNFSLYRAQTVSITFLDETTNAVVNTSTITAEFISDDFSYNYTTTNGTLFVDLLAPEAYTIRYGANNYTTRFYSLTIDSGSFNALNLTLCPDTICSAVTITVKDQFDNTLEGAIVKVLKYDVTVNGYTLQEVLTTNFEGQTESNLQINNEYYKFIIEYDGETVLTTLPTYVYGSTITFVVNLGSTGFEEYFSVNDLTGYISEVSDNLYSFTWTDTDNTATQGCVYAYLQTMTATTLYNSTCVSSAAGTTFVSLDNSTGKTYLLYGIVTKDGTDFTMDTDIVRFDTTLPTADSRIDLLILFLLLLAVIFVGVWNPTIAVVLAGTAPFLLVLTGIVNISIGVAGILLILSVIVAYIINR